MSDAAFITDGTVAAIGLVLGLINMGVNHCPNDGCLAKNERQSYHNLSVGEVVFQEQGVGSEIYYRRDTKHGFGPFQITWGASVTEDGGAWLGVGSVGAYHSPNDRWFVEFHSMPGIYFEGSDVDLGGPIEFRSGLAVGYEAKNGIRASLSFDHRSNAGLYGNNPGLETVQFRVSIPTK